ncbi:acyl-CoA dehydrogenase [Ketobacter sp. MCCC 1A13808]|uniref:acyl-CoA dehydrogenase family protein n=1 Tax=Ketobacter sp. MCCC 1A13808 TaxID=2602738 RepID=UPI000F23B7C5|nr:acyl-CoA dehydrogenase family protein [Ketobacter sp. MCCC 1A13808]MVF11299.1 acyl-CoA dehydrogenase [Ketobacter sp. MCCC 1A13808]RLP53571.1 MAG: acyl-CoA dehydrogenase [Ketobacter sp.]
MDLSLKPEYRQFREEVREFLNESLTDDIRQAGRLSTSVFFDKERTMAWQKILHKKGWVAPHWPRQYGGTGWDVVQRSIFAEESLKADAPQLIPMGLQMCGPCIIGCGTPEQKEYYLPRILSGDDFWCQGYSEPNAGSDLASLQTTAVSDGDDYIVNGTKIWTTYAHYANKIFCLVRTDKQCKPQQGITFLLMDMDAPGITVEPIIGLDGVREQNTVFFDNVRVPKSNRIGAENEGWTVAKYLLMFERGGQEYAPGLHHYLKQIKAIARQQPNGFGGYLLEDPHFMRRLGEVEIEISALEFTENRIKAALGSGQSPGAVASMTKIVGTELSQKLTQLAVEAVGVAGLPLQLEALQPGSGVDPIGPDYALTVMPKYLNARATSIYGGSNEIQRGIIAKTVLGL